MRRVPETLSSTDSGGYFNVELMADEYYIGIMLRTSGPSPGPPREGEKFYFATSGEGKLRTFIVTSQLESNVETIDGAPPESFDGMSDHFIVKGTVRKENGEPFPGVVVLGKSQLNMPKPEFISRKTGDDGSYQLELPADIKYYLVARETIADARPRPGSYIGTYGIMSSTGLAAPSIFSAGSPPPGVIKHDNSKARTIAGGVGESLADIDLYMYMVPDPEVIKASIQGASGSPKFRQGTTLNDIMFPPNSHVLNEPSYAELDKWVNFLQNHSSFRIEVDGHTDDKGHEENNRKISLFRAQAVADYLAHKGISKSRMIIRGLGSERPLTPNDSDENRQFNRRVEIRFVELETETSGNDTMSPVDWVR
ncbi:MAG: OmpA family protein [Proteobacteria bacterium]|nr:OmpA family protein [Pseudomonadota bacterium]MBU1686530.1 OmpA family protein [Pseudomonadota bacterium]